jgi:diacylglycerol kinase (ATP)
MGSPFGTLALITDPSAGNGTVAEQLPVLEAGLRSRGLDHTLFIASDTATAAERAAEALAQGHRFLVAVGDDGTVSDVVNAMFKGGGPVIEDPVLGLVSAGTGCDLSRSFGLPEDTDRACGHLAGDNTYRFDLMKITCEGPDGQIVTRYAHNLAEVGLGGQIAREQLRMPSKWGGAGKLLAFWSAYLSTNSWQVKVDVDKGGYEGDAFNVVIANGQFTSGGMRLSPRSFPGDGVLDALVFHGPRSGAYTMLPRLFRHGEHVPDPNIGEYRAKIRVAVNADGPMPVVADGSIIGSTPATFLVVPQQILVKL